MSDFRVIAGASFHVAPDRNFQLVFALIILCANNPCSDYYLRKFFFALTQRAIPAGPAPLIKGKRTMNSLFERVATGNASPSITMDQNL